MKHDSKFINLARFRGGPIGFRKLSLRTPEELRTSQKVQPMKNRELPVELAPTVQIEVKARLEEIRSHRAMLVQSRIRLDQRLESVQQATARKYLRGDRSGLQEVNAITAELQATEGALSLLDNDEQVAQVELKRRVAVNSAVRGPSVAISESGKSLRISGERGRNRTYNLVIKSHLLCQLSYAPRVCG